MRVTRGKEERDDGLRRFDRGRGGALESVEALTRVSTVRELMEIATGVLFQDSPSSGFVTGAVLDSNGGLSM